MKPYAATRNLEQAILDAAPVHVATSRAPNTWHALQEWAAGAGDGEPVPVYDGGCEDTIYSSPAVNHAFRAWHDKLHILLSASFSVEDELLVCEAHIDYLWQHRIKYRLDMMDLAAMRADVAGQVLYYAKHKRYVRNQAVFVANCLARGIVATVASGEVF